MQNSSLLPNSHLHAETHPSGEPWSTSPRRFQRTLLARCESTGIYTRMKSKFYLWFLLNGYLLNIHWVYCVIYCETIFLFSLLSFLHLRWVCLLPLMWGVTVHCPFSWEKHRFAYFIHIIMRTHSHDCQNYLHFNNVAIELWRLHQHCQTLH